MLQNNPTITVVVPTRNRRDKIFRCLEGLASQTRTDFELIIVDDASTDDTPVLLGDVTRHFPHLDTSILRNNVPIGANPSRNRGINTARGDFVAFLDDDCIPEPQWLHELMTGFSSDKVVAVTGGIVDPDPQNLAELAFKGTHRVHGNTTATRLIAGNMCIRKKILQEIELDEDRAKVSDDMNVSGRGDEEGLFLTLRSHGWEIKVVHTARAYHDHHYTNKNFFRQAYRSGMATARLGYKYHLPPRPELTPLLCGYLLIIPALFFRWIWIPAGICFALFLAAITYNELCRKRKTIWETLITYPHLMGYYHARFLGWCFQYIRLLLRVDKIQRIRLRPANRIES